MTHAQYVPSNDNPADGPSHGIYPSAHLLLPPVELPAELTPFVINFDAPLTTSEVHRRNCGQAPSAARKPPRHHSARDSDNEWSSFERWVGKAMHAEYADGLE